MPKLAGPALIGICFAVVIGSACALVTFLLVPATWRTQAEVVVDWSRMPPEASGDQRGRIQEAMRDLLNDNSHSFTRLVAADPRAQARASASESTLRSVLTMSAHVEDEGNLLRLHIEANQESKKFSRDIVEAGVEATTRALNSYRDLEWAGQAYHLGQQADRSRDSGWFLVQLLAMSLAQPVRITREPTTNPDFGASIFLALAAGVLFGLFFGLAAFLTVLWLRWAPVEDTGAYPASPTMLSRARLLLGIPNMKRRRPTS